MSRSPEHPLASGGASREMREVAELAMREQMAALSSPGLMTRALDSVAGAISPKWLGSRLGARADLCMAAFEAAEMNRMTADWIADTLSGDQEILPELSTINARSRQGHRDSWAIRGICSSYRRDLGCPLPRLCARDPRKPRREGKLKHLNGEINFLWDEWSMDPGLCDLAGMLPLFEQIGLIVEEFVQVGNGFLVESFSPRRVEGMVPLMLQRLEVEQLASDIWFTATGKNEIKNGIEVDEFGRSVAYWFYLGAHPLEDPASQPTRVEAWRVRHFMRPSRVRQALAPSQLSAVLLDDRELQGYLKSEARSKRLEACVAYQLIRDKGSKSGGLTGSKLGLGAGNTGREEVTDGAGRPVRQMQSGTILNNPAGTRLELMNPMRPGAQFDMYVKRKEAHIAAGADRSRSAVAREFTASYTAENRGMIEDGKVNRPLQDLLVAQALRGIHRSFVRLAILTPGVLSDEAVAEARELMRDARLRRYLYATDWQRPEEEPLDKAKDAAANKIAIDYRWNSRERILARRRTTVGEVFSEIGDEIVEADKNGFELPENQGVKTDASEPRPRGSSRAPDGAGDENNGTDTDEEARQAEPMRAEAHTSNQLGRSASLRETDALAAGIVREAVSSDA